MGTETSHDLRRTRWGQRRLPSFDYRDTNHAYFVTARAHPVQENPFADPRLAEEVINAIDWIRTNRSVRVYAFCLMPDHLHLLLQLGSYQWSLGDVVGTLKSFTTKQSWTLGHEGELWQARFHDHIVRQSEDGHNIAEYIVQNPMRKGLVTDAGHYPYSGCPDPM